MESRASQKRAQRVPLLQRRLTRAVVQALFLFAFLALFVVSAVRSADAGPARLPFLLDPLVVLAASLSGRAVLPGWGWAALGLALALGLGRVWCGWLCPVGTVLDAFSIRPRRTGPRPTDRLRFAKHFLLLTVVVMAALGSAFLLFLDPLSLATRTLSVAVWPALNYAFGGAQAFLYRFGILQEPLLGLENLLRRAVLPSFQPYLRLNLLVGLIAMGIVALEGLGARFWCRSLCPLGALLALVSKLAFVKRRVKQNCISCGRCERICPTGTIDAGKAYESDAAECIMCLDCARACPVDAIAFPAAQAPAARQPYDAGRRDVVGGLLAGTALVGLFGASSERHDGQNFLLRPPGALDPEFLDKCIRCGECMRACPTAALHPALFQAGLEGLFSPLLVPRLGYCDYSCNRCGQVCPTGAIPPLDLETKRLWVNGQAYIDEQRCIPWTGDGQCSVCEEMCPVPVKAIWLEEVEIQREDGARFTVRRPHVRRHLCIGCGTCENKCPVSGEAAIRVHVAGAERLQARLIGSGRGRGAGQSQSGERAEP